MIGQAAFILWQPFGKWYKTLSFARLLFVHYSYLQ